MTDTTEATQADQTVVELGRLAQQHADLGVALAWLTENWAGLPRPKFSVTYRERGGIERETLTLKVQVGYVGSATLADCARRLAVGAPLGATAKVHDGGYVRMQRWFGSVLVEAWTGQDRVCTARVVGTETVEVPDPNAPTISVERPVVAWDCDPILAPTSTEAAG